MYQCCRGACAAHKGHARKRDTSPALGQAQHQQGKGGFFTSSAHPQTPHRGQLHPLKSPGALNSLPGMLCAPQCCPPQAWPAAQLSTAMPFPELLCPLLAGKQ